VLMYKAGHGVQLHHQWLCGVDAGHSRHTTSMPGCVPWASAMATIQDAGLASLRVILVRDCCANHFSAPASSSTGCSNCATVSSARLIRCQPAPQDQLAGLTPNSPSTTRNSMTSASWKQQPLVRTFAHVAALCILLTTASTCQGMKPQLGPVSQHSEGCSSPHYQVLLWWSSSGLRGMWCCM